MYSVYNYIKYYNNNSKYYKVELYLQQNLNLTTTKIYLKSSY